MDLKTITNMYNFSHKTVVITGGAGVLGGEMACALVGCGANVAVLDREVNLGDEIMKRIDTSVGQFITVYADVLDRDVMKTAAGKVVDTFGKVDALINGAGGNHPKATTSDVQSFFDLDIDAFKKVSDLNLIGTVLPSQVFGEYFVKNKAGVILNISSMSAFAPLTKVGAYSAAKAAVSNFTQWLAVHMAQEYSADIRVNAIAPGFFLTLQNKFLLTDEKSGELTARGKTIIEHTPMKRFGDPQDLLGTVLWLLSPASAFVTGTVIPIDGGFSAFSGV
jgi:NAD(P)-dependent dehydrogenase (short-subunit alcohol dehydrogenase family)